MGTPIGMLNSPRLNQPRRGDAGNATAEFVMVTALVVMLFGIVLQVAFAMYVHNMLVDAASSGARYGALIDRDPSDGVARSQQLIDQSLPAGYVTSISSSETDYEGVAVLEIQVSGTLPVVGPFGFDQGIEVTGHAIQQ